LDIFVWTLCAFLSVNFLEYSEYSRTLYSGILKNLLEHFGTYEIFWKILEHSLTWEGEIPFQFIHKVIF